MPWSDITKRESFQALPPEEQTALKVDYFKHRILPKIREKKVPQDEIDPLFQEWMNSPDDSGQGYGTSLLSSAGRGATSFIPGAIGGAGELLGIDPLVEAGDATEGWLNEQMPINPIYREDWGVKGANAVGQAGSMIGLGGVGGLTGKILAGTKGIRAGAEAAALGSGFLSGAREGGKAADQYGMEGAPAYLRKLLGGATTVATEKLLFGLGSETAAARKILGDTLEQGAGKFSKAVLTEAGEEAVEQGAGNLQTTVLAPEGVQTPGFLEGTGEAAILGGIGGGTFGAFNAAVGTGQPVSIESGESVIPPGMGAPEIAVEMPGVGTIRTRNPAVTAEGIAGWTPEEVQQAVDAGVVSVTPPPPPKDEVEQVIREAEINVQSAADVAPETAKAMQEVANEEAVETLAAQPTQTDEEQPTAGTPSEELRSPVAGEIASKQSDYNPAHPQTKVVFGKEGSRVTDEVKSDEYTQQGGWKLHLAVAPENYEAVDRWLADNHKGQYKLLSGGETESGKDFTVYLGDKDSANQLAEKMRTEIGDQLLPSDAAVASGDAQFNDKVAGRWDIQKTKVPHPSLRDFQFYGRGGIPADDLAVSHYRDLISPDAEVRRKAREAIDERLRVADLLMRKHYGERYSGKGPTDWESSPEFAQAEQLALAGDLEGAERVEAEWQAKQQAAPQAPPEQSSGSVPLMVTRDMRQQLYDRGYTKAQVNKMKPAEAHDILSKQPNDSQATTGNGPVQPEPATASGGGNQSASPPVDQSPPVRPEPQQGAFSDYLRSVTDATRWTDADYAAAQRFSETGNFDLIRPLKKKRDVIVREFYKYSPTAAKKQDEADTKSRADFAVRNKERPKDARTLEQIIKDLNPEEESYLKNFGPVEDVDGDDIVSASAGRARVPAYADVAYMAAVESGNLEAAQVMVDDIAEQFGSMDTEVVRRDEAGRLLTLNERFGEQRNSQDLPSSPPEGMGFTPKAAQAILTEKLGLTNFTNVVFGNYASRGGLVLKGFVRRGSSKIYINLPQIRSADELVDTFNEEATHLVFERPEVAQQWQRVKELVPQDQLDALRAEFEDRGYTPEVWDEEAYNQIVRRTGLNEMQKSAFRRFWEALKAAVGKLFGVTDANELNRLSGQILRYALQHQQDLTTEAAERSDRDSVAAPFRMSQEKNRDRENFIRDAQIKDWDTNRKRGLRTFADSYLRKFYGNPQLHPALRGILSITDGSLLARPSADGKIELGLRVDKATRDVGAEVSEEAVKQFIADAIEEEITHVADLLAQREAWVQSGRHGSFKYYLLAHARNTLDSLVTAYVGGGPGVQQDIRAAFAASTDAYEGKQLPESFEDAAIALRSDPVRAYQVVNELVRQLVQLRRTGRITETGWKKVVGTIQQWLEDALAALKLISAKVRDGKFGDLLKQRVEQTEAMLAELEKSPDGDIQVGRDSGGKGAIHAATPGSDQSEPGKRFSQQGERIMVDERVSEELRDVPPTQFDVRTQKETMAKAKAIIAEKGRTEALAYFSNDDSPAPPEVRVAGLYQLMFQFDSLAGLEKAKGNEPGSARFDDLADLAVEAKAKVEELLNIGGRTVNIANAYARMSPDGALRRFERQLEKVTVQRAKGQFGADYEKIKAELQRLRKAVAEARKDRKKTPLDTSADEVDEADKSKDPEKAKKAEKKQDEALKAKGITQRALDQLAKALSDTPSSKAAIHPIRKLINEHIKDRVPDFIDQMKGLKVGQDLAEQLNRVIELNRDRAEVVAREKALQQAIESLKPRTAKSRQRVSKLLNVVLRNAESGNLSRTKLANALSEALGVPVMTPAFREEVAAMVRQINALPEGSLRQEAVVRLNSKLAMFEGIPAMDALIAMWYGNILAGLSTQAVNVWGNGAQMFLRTLALTIGTGSLTDAMAMIRGMSAGYAEGMREARSTWKDGMLHKTLKMDDMQKLGALEVMSEIPNKNFGHWLAYVGSLGGLTKYVFRAMQAVDAVFWYSAYEGRAYLAATRAVKDKGLNPGTAEFNAEFLQQLGAVQSVEERMQQAREELTKAGVPPTADQVARRAYEIGVQQRSTDVQEESATWADRLVSQQKPEGSGRFVSQILTAIQNVKPFGIPVLVPLAPFNKIVSNLFESSIDFTGVGIIRGYLGHHLTGGSDARQFSELERRERMMAGAMGLVASGTAWLIAQGFKDEPDEDVPFMIYGFGPKDKNQREQMPKGWRPFTVKVGDAYWNYAETPLGMMMASVGSWMDSERYDKGRDKKSTSDRMLYSMLSAARGFSSQGVLSSIGTTMDVLTGQENPNKLKKMPVQTASGGIPAQGLLRDVSVIFDDNKIDDSTLYAALVKDIPVLKSEGTRPALNIFGEPVKLEGLPVVRRFTAGQREDPAADFIGRNNLNIPAVPQAIEVGDYLGRLKDPMKRHAMQLMALENGVLTSDQRYQFVKRSGELTKKAVERMRESTGGKIDAKRVEMFQKRLNDAVHDARKRAMLELIRTFK